MRRISSVVSDFTFTTSRAPAPRTMRVTISFASTASPAQCTSPPARETSDSSRTRSSSRRRSDRCPNRLPCPAKPLPVGRLGDDGRPPRADRRRREQDVRAGARVGQGDARRALERHRRRRTARGVCSCREHLREMDRAHRAAMPLEPSPDVEETGGVAGADSVGTRLADAAKLVREHRASRRPHSGRRTSRRSHSTPLRPVAGAARPRGRHAGGTRGDLRHGALAASGTWGGT